MILRRRLRWLCRCMEERFEPIGSAVIVFWRAMAFQSFSLQEMKIVVWIVYELYCSHSDLLYLPRLQWLLLANNPRQRGEDIFATLITNGHLMLQILNETDLEVFQYTPLHHLTLLGAGSRSCEQPLNILNALGYHFTTAIVYYSPAVFFSISGTLKRFVWKMSNSSKRSELISWRTSMISSSVMP